MSSSRVWTHTCQHVEREPIEHGLSVDAEPKAEKECGQYPAAKSPSEHRSRPSGRSERHLDRQVGLDGVNHVMLKEAPTTPHDTPVAPGHAPMLIPPTGQAGRRPNLVEHEQVAIGVERLEAPYVNRVIAGYLVDSNEATMVCTAPAIST